MHLSPPRAADTSVGDKTCHGGWSPGSYGHYEQDAQLFADWEVDYVRHAAGQLRFCSRSLLTSPNLLVPPPTHASSQVKMDYCGGNTSPDGHMNFSKALNATGRQIVLELCRGPYMKEDHWGYAPGIAQVWRAAGDHHDNFASTLDQLKNLKGRGSWSGPHAWAYGDMMMTGGEGCKDYDPHTPQHCPGQTDNEYRTEFSLYAVSSSPMMIGTDIRDMTPIMSETMLNADALAINQDWNAVPGDQQSICDGAATAWVRHLSPQAGLNGATVAIGVPNLGDTATTVDVCFADLGFGAEDSVKVRDVWAKKDAGTFTGKFSREVDTHDTLLLLLTPV